MDWKLVSDAVNKADINELRLIQKKIEHNKRVGFVSASAIRLLEEINAIIAMHELMNVQSSETAETKETKLPDNVIPFKRRSKQ